MNNDNKTGIELIAQERKEQIEKHHQLIEDDAEYNNRGELSAAAHLLISYNDNIDPDYVSEKCSLFYLVTKWNEARLFKMMNKTYKERLIIAGALIAAEIDRLNYIENE